MIRSGRGTAAPAVQPVEALDRRGDLRRRVLALHRDRPDHDAARKAVGEAVQDVADHRAGRRGDDADDAGQERQFLLALGGEEPLRGETLSAVLQQLEQRADSRQLDRIDDELVFRAAGIGGEPSGGDDLHPILGLDRQTHRRGAPAHRVKHGVGVLQREIQMAGADPLEAADLAAHADGGKIFLDRALERRRQLGNGIFALVRAPGLGPGLGGGERQVVHRPIIEEPGGTR